MEVQTFMVAAHRFTVAADEGCRSWRQVAGHYAPFATEAGDGLFALTVESGEMDAEAFAGRQLIYREDLKDNGMMRFAVYGSADGSLAFEISYPHSPTPNGWVFANSERKKFRIVISESCEPTSLHLWEETATLATGAMLCFMLATNGSDTLTMHSSCIKQGDRAFLFLGKSGTGKSTHARLWLKNIEGAMLLNDDHPIIRLTPDGHAMAYGSPWSGKTDCYVNDSAPIAAIVKIEQAPRNEIRRQLPIEAYSKLMVSASGMTWETEMATARHQTMERLIAAVPCYELKCLPDDEAARLCHKETNK